MSDTSSLPTIPTPCVEKSFEDFSHILSKDENMGKTASPPHFSNIVFKTIHDAEFNLDVLFNIIPVVKLSPEDIKKSTTVSSGKKRGKKESEESSTIIPGSNVEDFNELFISVRKFPKARGWREPCKIKSFLDMDFFFNGKSFHLKVSANKIAIIGGGSLDVSENLLNTIYGHLIDLNNYWMKFSDLSRDNINHVSECFLNEEYPDDEEDSSFYNLLDSIIDRNNEDVMERLRDLNPIFGTPMYQNEPKFTRLMNCNSVFNYRLPSEVCLGEKSIHLTKLGYDVIYHNSVIVKCMKALWRDEANDKEFSFSIQNCGTIKQNSSHTHEENLHMYRKIVTDLGFEPYREGCEYAKKTRPKANEVVPKNEGCIQILDRFLSMIRPTSY